MTPMWFRTLLLLTALFSTVLAGAPGRAEELILATTTSVRDTGLLDVLLPRFEKQAGAKVKALAVGSGAALRMGADGNADVLLTHAPEGEEALVRSEERRVGKEGRPRMRTGEWTRK